MTRKKTAILLSLLALVALTAGFFQTNTGAQRIANLELAIFGGPNFSTPVAGQLNGVVHPASGTSGGVLAFTSTSALGSSALLTANSPVLGGGAGVAPATVAGITSDGVSILTLGVAGTSVGKVAFANATSGTVTVAPVTGALGSVTLSLPAATDTLVGKATTDSLSNKTFPTAGVGFTNATSGTITVAAPTGALGTPTLTLPAATGSLATGYTCGTIAAGGACANTTLAGTGHWIAGIATLASNTSTITGISPAFTSSSTFFCVANDITTRANPVQAIPASGSTVTFTNTTGASDNIQFFCAGS